MYLPIYNILVSNSVGICRFHCSVDSFGATIRRCRNSNTIIIVILILLLCLLVKTVPANVNKCTARVPCMEPAGRRVITLYITVFRVAVHTAYNNRYLLYTCRYNKLIWTEMCFRTPRLSRHSTNQRFLFIYIFFFLRFTHVLYKHDHIHILFCRPPIKPDTFQLIYYPVSTRFLTIILSPINTTLTVPLLT